MEDEIQELSTRLINAIIDRITNKVMLEVNNKFFNYDPTAHPEFDDAVRDAMDGRVTESRVEDMISNALDSYDPADSRYFTNGVKDVLNECTFSIKAN